MTILEKQMFEAGWVRCPNVETRWYAGHAGKRQPVHPLELRVEDDAIWVVTNIYACGCLVRLMRFATVAELDSYLTRNGCESEAAAAFSNSWD